MEASNNAAAGAASRELRLTRRFNAPRELVFAAWTDPAQLAQWWGPHGFTAPRCELDASPGGAIHIDMRGPDGAVYPMGGEVRELDPPSRLVFTATAMPQADGSWGFENLNTITFAEEDGGTRMDLHVQVLWATPAAEPALSGMQAGWAQSLERLDNLVDQDIAAREIVLSRVFDAPRELVWQAWTDHNHADKWWGPNGFSNTTIEHDFRVGGSWRHIMHGPDGRDYPSRKVYLEIDEPNRIVNTHGWDDDSLPPLFLATITFKDLGAHKTELEMRSTFATVAERERVVKEHGAIEGGQQTLARLDAYLSGITHNTQEDN